ncbi:hypothetical protein D3C87_1127130 [compost metagenome]
MPVGGGGVDRGQQLLVDGAARGVVGAQAALFHHDLHLAIELVLLDDEVGHAVGFQLHHLRQVLLGDLLVVEREVAVGHGVLAAAKHGDLARELAHRHLRRALEHHVFEHVGHARGAAHLVDAARAVPDLVRHGGRAMVFLDDHAHAVGKLEFGGARLGLAHRGSGPRSGRRALRRGRGGLGHCRATKSGESAKSGQS